MGLRRLLSWPCPYLKRDTDVAVGVSQAAQRGPPAVAQEVQRVVKGAADVVGRQVVQQPVRGVRTGRALVVVRVVGMHGADALVPRTQHGGKAMSCEGTISVRIPPPYTSSRDVPRRSP